MKVKLLISRAGAGFSQNVGDEIDVSEAEGLRLVQAGKAVAVAEKRETATRKPAETRKKK